jgi:hypothetical protein
VSILWILTAAKFTQDPAFAGFAQGHGFKFGQEVVIF